ncbi:hypothetical protein SAMN04487881_2194 [Marinobacter sp. es.048]|uniref:hypothetical protein n=1 Tax=Marinobacter sp. es.048 TaxID=1761795 RepID=UPI000B595618|nr:hypothetical protein [Marinobacter sp. es.048]SNC68155.1 hypothetical protein SAMN04487881_2194 [Marinobacter sp. es.048]
MSGKVVILLTLVTAGVVATGYFLSADNHSDFSWFTNVANSGETATARNAVSAKQLSADPAGEPEPPSDSALGFMLASVADQYAESIKYPPWSVPLSSEQANAYRGNYYEPVSLPLEGDGQFTVTLEKYRFTAGERILVAAAIQGSQIVGRTLSATLERPDSRDALASTTLEEAGSPGYFEGTLSADHAAGEYRLIVEARLDGKPVRHVSTMAIEPYLGEFEGLGDARIQGNNLIIPVRFSPEDSGYYALSAQLFVGQRPVAQLQIEKRLDNTSNTINLKAHGTVLANQTVDGQLQLKNLQIRQLPARPGDRTNYAFGPDEGYAFTPPDLDSLTDTPAVDPESEQRAALLRQLADKF